MSVAARIVRVEVVVWPEASWMLVLSRETLKKEEAERNMFPENPPWLVKVMLELPVVPSVKSRKLGLVDRVKSDGIEGLDCDD